MNNLKIMLTVIRPRKNLRKTYDVFFLIAQVFVSFAERVENIPGQGKPRTRRARRNL